MRAKLRFALTLLFFVLYSIPAMIHLYSVWLLCTLFTSAATRRRLAGEWRGWWADKALKMVGFLLDTRVRFELPPGFEGLDGPVIVVSNHVHTMDILIIAAMLKRLGRPQSRWVLKKPLRHRALFVGHSCIMTECAFVGRDGDANDIAEVARCARTTGEDRASIVIFPEGTRFTAKKRSGGFMRLLAPKRGGFSAIREALPDYPVLSVTISFAGRDGATMFDAHAFSGKDVLVRCELHAPDAAAGPDWLHEEWRRKDQQLSAHP